MDACPNNHSTSVHHGGMWRTIGSSRFVTAPDHVERIGTSQRGRDASRSRASVGPVRRFNDERDGTKGQARCQAAARRVV